MTAKSQQVQRSDARRLPVVAADAERIGLVQTIDAQLNCKMKVSPSRAV